MNVFTAVTTHADTRVVTLQVGAVKAQVLLLPPPASVHKPRGSSKLLAALNTGNSSALRRSAAETRS